MTGLFVHRSHNQGSTIWQAQRRRHSKAARAILLDLFAENLSNNDDLARAAAKIGKTVGWGEQALREIRKGLGWQAR